jgi:hypothetical protein
MPRGGKRPGSGRKPGSGLGVKTAETLSKAEHREALRQIIVAHMAEMTAAQIAHAKGIKFLVARAKTGGKFERVSEADLDKILKGQDDGNIVLEVWDKDPSVQAYTDLMNRALDKPAEQEQEHHVTGVLKVMWDTGD